MERKYLLFDLDGTLTDPALGITNSVMKALEYFGIKTEKREDLYVYIGPPLFDSFVNYAHLSDEDADMAMVKYREYFSVKGLFENDPYPEIANTLQTLKDAGYKLAVATSKPEVYAIQILDHFKLSHYFEVICGSELKGRKEDKADVIRKVMDYFQDENTSHYLMIGDREHDAIGAFKNNISCLGVTYGYGSYLELKEANCIDIVTKHQDIINYLKSH